MSCINCGRGLHEECRTKCKRCHPEPKIPEVLGGRRKQKKEKQPPGRPLKEPHEMRDPSSSGRKRAAVWFPIFRDQPCEWRMQKNCGGGLRPITGCENGFQQERQHGPIKDTRQNDPSNVHRICIKCHHRWHVLNDPVYDEEVYRKLPHAPEPATLDEVLTYELWWKTERKRKNNGRNANQAEVDRLLQEAPGDADLHQ